MKNITVLDSSMFDDGSLECFNYWIADQDGTYQVGYGFIKELGLESLILENKDKGYINVKNKGLVYGGLQILEIQWG